jgi:hypothetical protein
MKTQTIILILIVLIMAWGCRTGEDGGVEPTLNPAITSISPGARALSLPAFRLTVHGENFRDGAEIWFNQIRKSTERIDDSELRCLIDPGDLLRNTSTVSSNRSAAMNNLVRTVSVYVFNYASGGRESGRSNLVDFSILAQPRFNEPVNISQTSRDSTFPMIAVDESDVIHVVWKDNSDGEWAVYYRRSTDFGVSWEDIQPLSGEGVTVCCPELAVDNNGNIYVVYSIINSDQTGAILFIRSPDHGATWQLLTMLSPLGESAYIPDISTNNYGNIAVVWHSFTRPNRRRSDIFLTRSDDYGVTWSTPVNVSDNVGQSESPVTAVDAEGNIYTAWKDNRPGEWEVFFRHSPDGGITWDDIIDLSADGIHSVRPVLSCDYNGQVFVTWFNIFNLDLDIYYTRSWNRGQDWLKADVISSDGSNESREPALAVDDSGNIDAAWTNYNLDTKVRDIVFRRAQYGLPPWSEEITVSAGNALYPDYADIAVDREGNIYIVWQQRFGDFDQIMLTSSRE